MESHDCNWEASGCARRSFFVCFSYDFKAASKMTWKREEATAVAGVWDIIGVATVEERNNADDVQTRAGMRVMIGK